MPAPSKPLLTVLNGGKAEKTPIWLMRQAGRYLPEYRALRAKKGGFLELVYDPEAAAEITLQPIRRFGFDGAILFSDILIVPLRARPGPALRGGRRAAAFAAAGRCRAGRARAASGAAGADLPDCGESEARSAAETTLLGFAGSPWTVATYMVAGQGSRDQAEARRFAYRRSRGLPGDHRRDRGDDASTICRARSRPAPKRCNCSTAGPAACRRRSSSAG